MLRAYFRWDSKDHMGYWINPTLDQPNIGLVQGKDPISSVLSLWPSNSLDQRKICYCVSFSSSITKSLKFQGLEYKQLALHVPNLSLNPESPSIWSIKHRLKRFLCAKLKETPELCLCSPQTKNNKQTSLKFHTCALQLQSK